MIRRIHLYLALFLTPWVILYAVSTAVMNHRTLFRPKGSPAPAWAVERSGPYARTFGDGAKPADMARQILIDIGLDGAHTASLSKDGQRLTITRQDPFTPRRVVYVPGARTLTVERQASGAPAFLERMHRRRGYQHPYAADDAWAVSVDVVIAAILFWALSGVWLWWEMKRTRWWGAACVAAGCGLFTLFLVTI